MNYLLDTSICIALLSPESNRAVTRSLFNSMQDGTVFVSSIVLFELWYGVAKSRQQTANLHRSAYLLSLGIVSLDFAPDDAEAAGRIRAALETRKQPIGPYDTLIAGQALARNLTLVTTNQREFARIEGLRWEDWSQPAPTL